MTTLPASPASLTDAALDELDEDAGIFLSKETHPREEYYQRRITRSRTRLTGTQTVPSYRGGGPRIEPLDLVNETEPLGIIDRQPESTQLLLPIESTEVVSTSPPRAVFSDLEEQGQEGPLPTASSSQAAPPLCPSRPPPGLEESTSGDTNEEVVPGVPVPLNIQSSTDAPLTNAVPLPTPTTPPLPTSDNDTLPSVPLQMPQTPSTDLICFESFQLPSPTRAVCTPPGIGTLTSQPTDFLCASPATLPPRVPNNEPTTTPDHSLGNPSEPVQNGLLFTPRTTASFAADVQVPINTALFMTREKDKPTSEIEANEQETGDEEETRPVKRAKSETPVKSQNSNLSSSVRKPIPTPSRATQRGPLLGRSAGARSPEKGRMVTGSTPQRPFAPQTPTRPHNSSIKALPTPARRLFTTPQRPTLPQRPATGSKAGSARPPAAPVCPPSATSNLPSDFRFVFQSSMAMPKSPEARNHANSQKPEPEIKPVLLNDFKFVPAPVSSSKPFLSSPAKPSTSKSLGLSTSKKDPAAGAARASPIKFNMALLSPKKAGAVPKSSPTATERSAYGSPVRFAPPASSRLNTSSTLHSTTAAQGPFKGKASVKAALPAVPEASDSPLKLINGGPTVNAKPANPAPITVKPTALPKPKGFKFSKLPKPAGIPVPQYARTTTVNMVHVPRVDLGGSPTKQPPARPIPVPPPPVMPVAAPPPRKKIFRPVVPGTLTGWQGKPATMIETQDKSPTPESPKPPSDSSPEITSSEGDSSSVRRSTRRKVSNTRTPSPESVDDPSKSDVEEQSSPRRSRRISKEKENTVADDQPAKAAAASRPPPASRGRTPATPKAPAAGAPGFQMSDKELKSLTMKNTVRNQTYFVEIDLQVIRKDCPRPPSPSSRVRAAIGIEEKEAEAKKRGRAERAKKRGLLEDEMDREEDESPLKHFRGPGDEEDYETPKRRRLDGEGGFATGGVEAEHPFASLQLQPPPQGKKSRSRAGSSDPAAPIVSDIDPVDRFVKPNSKGRFVRWSKKLAFHCEAGEKVKVVSNSGKGILARDAVAANLDKVGNVPEAGKLPPEIRKNVVVVCKYVYADDPAEIQEDVEMEEEVDEVPSPPKKGKRKRTTA